MVQEILVYMVLASSSAYVLYKLAISLRSKKTDCDSCSGCTIKKQMQNKTSAL